MTEFSGCDSLKYIAKRSEEESTFMAGITEKSRLLRGMCQRRWKMASEWCTELGAEHSQAATGAACYSGRV
ncbi:MAG: hypothetical protein Q4F83_15045 [Eubacteriales bacterium]|nr:hypothetical protein [Eubacteriales bacterium]